MGKKYRGPTFKSPKPGVPTTPPPVPRRAQINQEYSNLAVRLGDLHFQIAKQEKARKGIIDQMFVLEEESITLANQEALDKLKAEKKAENAKA